MKHPTRIALALALAMTAGCVLPHHRPHHVPRHVVVGAYRPFPYHHGIRVHHHGSHVYRRVHYRGVHAPH